MVAKEEEEDENNSSSTTPLTTGLPIQILQQHIIFDGREDNDNGGGEGRRGGKS